MPYQLVRDYISRETVEALEQLLEGARSGDVVGIAFAAALRGQRYVKNVAGSCYRNVTLARGMVAALDDELADIEKARAKLDPD